MTVTIFGMKECGYLEAFDTDLAADQSVRQDGGADQ
jgi:hypothetical protein